MNCEKYGNCGCPVLKKVTECKYLGIIIDNVWKFKTHIHELITRLRKTLPVLYKVRTWLSKSTKINLFNAWIMSIMKYGCSIYGSTTKSTLERLQKLQNKAVKVLFGHYTNKSTSQLYSENGIFTLNQLYTYEHITRNYFSNKHKIFNERNSRANNNWIKLPLWRNSYGKRNQDFVIPWIFNKIPLLLRNVQTVCKMKYEIKKWVLTSSGK